MGETRRYRKNQKKIIIILEQKMNGRKKERKKQWPKLGTVKGDRLRNLNEINKYAYIYIYIYRSEDDQLQKD